MTPGAMAHRVETQTRAVLLIIVVLLTSASWLITYYQVANMGLLMRLGVPMSLGMEGSVGFTSLVVFLGMWLAMMLAMMLPSSYPMLLLQRTVSRKKTPDARWNTVCFASGYFITWTAMGLIFYIAYVAIGGYRSTGNSDQLLLRAAGVTVALAGLYQWSRMKAACLRHCQSPFHFVMEHWRDGKAGAFRMGAEHGMYCFGCCWGLMVILFVMGLMNLAWMAAIGAIILLEKIASASWIPRLVGLIFIILGMTVALFPSVLSKLSSHVILAG